MSYLVAREYMERALAVAEAANERAEVRLIARRLCEVIEQEDLDEAGRLHAGRMCEVADPPDRPTDLPRHAGDSPPPLVAPMTVIAHALEASHAADAERAASPFQLRYWGDPVLKTVCTPVMAFEDVPPGLVDAMRTVVDRASPPGLGLAANQVGATCRVIVVRFSGSPDLTVLMNPILSQRSPETEHGPEGCLSIPGFQTNIKRHTRVTVDYRDETWQLHRKQATGLAARILQHEVDHLDGRLLVDGLSRQLRRQAERAMDKVLGR